MNFAKQAKSLDSFLRETRHELHMYPELPMQEIRTSVKVRQFLRDHEIEILPLDTPTSVAAIIRGGKPGPTVALRAELDALPIREETGLPFASRNEGVMHACGHDIHLSCLMGAAIMLRECAEEMSGNVVLLFQAAEENTLGALQMINAGVMDFGFEAVFGLHTNTNLPVGSVAFMPGPSQAGANMFSIEIGGQGGHGAFPNSTIDPIMIAATLISQLQTVVSRNLDPISCGVVSVCQISAGSSPNIIPQDAKLAGTIRYLDPEIKELIIRRMQTICAGIESGYGCSCSLSIPDGTPPVINDAALTEMAKRSCASVLGETQVKSLAPAMVGDDMAQFMTRVPGVLGALGVRNEDAGIVHGNHTSRFDADEDCLSVGAACMAQMAWDYLEKQG